MHSILKDATMDDAKLPRKCGSGSKKGASSAAMRQAFAKFDSNGNGTISAEELRAVLGRSVGGKPPKWTPAKIDELMRKLDTNGDGVLSMEELSVAFTRGQLKTSDPLLRGDGPSDDAPELSRRSVSEESVARPKTPKLPKSPSTPRAGRTCSGTARDVDGNLAAWSASAGSEEQQRSMHWRELGGHELEESLRGDRHTAPIALLNKDWLVARAEEDDTNHFVLQRRQDLCDTAFISMEELQAAMQPQDDELRIITLSYGWTTPAHPDPLGATLQRVAEVLRHYDGVWGVFWDFCSLMQHSPDPNGPRRTAEENKIFLAGLGSSMLYYAHPSTTVFRLTTWPKGYPESYNLKNANVAEYIDRGWCFAETCWAALTTNFERSLDLGKFTGTKTRLHGSNGVIVECLGKRQPPLLPEQFSEALKKKTFYNRVHDEPLVGKLYRDAYNDQLGRAEKLEFRRMNWGDNEAIQLAKVIGSGATPSLRWLNIAFNDFGDPGAKALAAAISKALPPLEKFEFKGSSKLGDPGTQALREAFRKCRESTHEDFSEARKVDAATEMQAAFRGKKSRANAKRPAVAS